MSDTGSTTNADDTLLRALLAKHEGIKFDVYDDATGKIVNRGSRVAGNLTIGVGRNLSAVGLSGDEIQLLLENDISRAVKALQEYPFFSRLTGARRDAVIDMMFNMGPKTFAEFTGFVSLMNVGNYEQAARDLLDLTAWAKEVPSRASDDANMILTGQYSSKDATSSNA